MNLEKLYFLTASITENKICLFDYFKSQKYAIYSFNEIGKISFIEGNENEITDKELSEKIQANLYFSGYVKIITNKKVGVDVFFFNEKIIKTKINFKNFWNEDVKLFNNKIKRVIIEFLSFNHILQTINFEFDELDLKIGENIHELIQDNKSILSEQILTTHNRYFGAIISKSIRSGYRENEKELKFLSSVFYEILPKLADNYFSQTFDKFAQNQNSFDSRFVAFIDILGFKNIVENNNPKHIRSLVSELKSTRVFEFFEPAENEKIDFKITYFSDCIVLSCKNDSTNYKEQVFDKLLQTIISIQIYFMTRYQYLIRGAISQGKLIHTKDYCFGPAFNRAYLLESNYTHYPRILIDLNIIHEINISSEVYKGEIFRFLDLISICFRNLKRKDGWDIKFWNSDTEWEFFRLIELIKKGLSSPKESVKLKYLYLANRFNEQLKELFDEHPDKKFKMLSKYPEINKTLNYIKV